MSEAAQALGIDVGGTKIEALRVGRDGSILSRSRSVTPADDPEATIAAMIEAAKGLLESQVVAIGVGAAGMVDASRGVLRFAPNLAWRELPIGERMSDALRPTMDQRGYGIILDVDDATAAAAHVVERCVGALTPAG